MFKHLYDNNNIFFFLIAVELLYAITSRGQRKVLLDGYMYTKHKERRHYTVWRCCERSTCNAQLCQRTLPPHQVMRRRKHPHPPNWIDYNHAIKQSGCNLQKFKTSWILGSSDNDLS